MYTLYNNGTPSFFNPTTQVSDPNSKSLRTQLDVQIEFVKTANDPAVFITDDKGELLDI